MQSLGYHLPGKKIVINLAPADLRKGGSHYDLPIALSIIGESGQDALVDADKYIIAGELGLDGSLRDIPGWVQAAELAKSTGRACILPVDSAKLAAAALGTEPKIYGADDLKEVIDILSDGAPDWTASDECQTIYGENQAPDEAHGWDDLPAGYETAKRVLEIAAAGGHHVLLMGAPGSGKAALAKALLDILPPMTHEQMLEVQRIYAAGGRRIVPGQRPFRAPHYAASLMALLGGGLGDTVLPGEVSLAHNGVFYADDLNSIPRSAREALRTPLEDGKVVITRLKSKVEYPAKPLMVFGACPCPCGYYGEGDRCTCTPTQRTNYLAKLSGPIYDRLTLQCWVHQTPTPGEVEETRVSGEPAYVVAQRVAAARMRQRVRQNNLNEDLSVAALDTIATLDEECREMMERLFEHMGLSARAYTRILRIARTIADLDGVEDILPHHIAEAATYRFLDRLSF